LKLLCIFVSTVLVPVVLARAQTSTPTRSSDRTLTITVLDENAVVIPAARVLLEGPGGPLHCETDRIGECRFPPLASGVWQLRAEKEGFYIFTLSRVQNSGTLEITLTHQQEVRETVNVTESPPAIDPAQISSQEQLSGIDITNIPYPNTRDYRYALNYIPGVVLDQTGQPHISGSETYQTLVLLDGFNVSQPANGQLVVRASTDALRTVSVETTRLPAQYGKGPAGALSLETGIGDDHYRFAVTNFLPSFQKKKGWTLDKVDPRFTVSGPIQKGRIWFFDGLDGEYDNVVIPELPAHQDTDTIWRLGNLAKLQANATSRDIVTASFLANRFHDDHFKFSTFAPATTTPEDIESAYVASLKEQHVFAREKLLEVGFGFDQYGLKQIPAGTLRYVLTPQTAQGNYYLHASTTASRWQALTNFYIPRLWRDHHGLTMGIDIDRLSYGQLFQRSPITSLRNCPQGSPFCYPVALSSVFIGGGPSTTFNTEVSGYLQDRWSVNRRLLIEPGLRFDWDEVVRRPLISPRLAGTGVVNESGNTKISAGVGITYESTSLSLVGEPQAGSRRDTFYDLNGNPATFQTSFAVDRSLLNAPRFLNWSVALEQKLPLQLFLKTEFIRRTGIHGFVFNTPAGASGPDFTLQNTREDRYYSFKVDLRRTFHKRYIVSGSYTRSSSTSNQVLDYSIDNLLISPQVAGPYPWDAPNRFISWGILPLVHGFDFAYSLEARSGFPFPILNQQQQLVAPPGVHRFDTYFTLNPHLEKRFHALGFYWALRGGFDNITNHQNAYVVNNILGSSRFLTFSNFDRRAFTARIRFLGRK
jgi:hypothetical protein